MRSLVILAALSLLVLVPAASAVVPTVAVFGPYADGDATCVSALVSTNHATVCVDAADPACPVDVTVNDVSAC